MNYIYSIKRYGQTSPYAVRYASEYSDPKIFWTRASKPIWSIRDPKFPEKFGAWVVPFERLGLSGGFKLHPPPKISGSE